ncbi:MAG: PqiC family protein [Verrucomicrobiales bacterium]
MMGLAEKLGVGDPARLARRCGRSALIVSVLILISGCSSVPDQFYMLSADGEPPAARAVAGTALSIGLGPVEIPDYIDRAELVFQSATHRFQIPSGHRWAGSLGDSVSGVLARNLSHRLESPSVYPFPWDPSQELRYTIPVRIRQFHAVSGGDAILDVSWELRDPATGKSLKLGSEVFKEALSEEGYDGLVAAQSRLLGQLADAIVAQLR